MSLTRQDARPYVAYVVDDAGSGRELGADPHAIVRESGVVEQDGQRVLKGKHLYGSVLVGWQCGFEPLFVAVHSYLDLQIHEPEAIEMATDYLQEIGWFAGEPTPPDYVL